jgi:hypothetical protein
MTATSRFDRSDWRARVPVVVGIVIVPVLLIDEIIGDVRVLFERVSEPAREATSASEIAVFNSAKVAVTVFVARLIDLFENVVVDESVTEMSEVKATVPVALGKVIVLSAVGSPALKVVSKSSSVVPSKTML